MKNEFKNLIESIDRFSIPAKQIEKVEIVDDLGLLEEWHKFKNLEETQLNEAPPVPAGATGIPKVDPRTTATIQRVKAVTRAPINVPATANAMAKANVGSKLNRLDQMNLGKLDQAVGNVTKQALFTPQTTGQTLTALQKATKMAQLAQAQSKK